jgi:hypothetical protein
MAAFDIINTKASPVDLQKWAEITVQRWQFAIAQKNLVYSGNLLRSFEHMVSGEANGNTALISFAFNYYLRMLEMNVGKGRQRGEYRHRSGLFTKPFYHEVHRLSELVAQMYANKAAIALADGISE